MYTNENEQYSESLAYSETLKEEQGDVCSPSLRIKYAKEGWVRNLAKK